VPQRRQKASSKLRSRSPRESVESLRRALKRESEERRAALAREKEALEWQTATAEILRSISAAKTDAAPVFEAIARNAHRLCRAAFCNVLRYDGERIHVAATHGFSPQETAKVRAKYPVTTDDRSVLSARVIRSCKPEFIADVYTDSQYDRSHVIARALFGVPMLHSGVPVGAIAMGLTRPGRVPKHQQDLLQTFAAQAVIAIENARLFNETKEALEQQTATSEILKVISSSPTDVQPVFDTIVRSSVRLCSGAWGALFTCEGNMFHLSAQVQPTAEVEEAYRSGFPQPIDDRTPSGRAVVQRRPVNVADIQETDYAHGVKDRARLADWRSVLTVPMMRGDTPIGAVAVTRRESTLFDDSYVALLKTFADQAVIAIENVRLFNETREALERQTATAEILKVIAASPSDVQPVFDAIVKATVRLIGGLSAGVTRLIDDTVHLAAFTSANPSGDEALKATFPRPVSEGLIGEAIRSRLPVLCADMETEPGIAANVREAARARGYRSVIVMPMIREGAAIGTLTVTRDAPGAFSDHRVRLLQTFADQAVIAIENVRLFNELQAMNSTLREALEQQTATGEILNVISRSTTDVQPVFDTIIRNAVRLCDGAVGAMFRYDGRMVHVAALYNLAPEVEELFRKAYPQPLSRENPGAQAILERGLVSLEDVEATDYSDAAKDRARGAGYRGLVAAPLMRGGVPIGSIAVGRRVPGKFPDSYVALLKTFADQAVIAIENVRLFKELQATNTNLRETLDQQTATSDILQVISKSPTDVKPVFDTILQNAIQLCEGNVAMLWQYDGEKLRYASNYNATPEAVKLFVDQPLEPGDWNPTPQAAAEKRIIHVLDVFENPHYRPLVPTGTSGKRPNAGTVLAVPLLREDELFGVITVWRYEKRLFTDRQVSMVNTFAAQAVIAIENTRLFKEVQARTEALTKSVGQLTALGEVGQAISSTLDLETVLKTIVSRAVQLAGLDGGSIYEFDERDERFHLRAAEHVEEEILEVSRSSPIRLGEGAVGRAGATREPVVVEDVLDESYQSRVRELLIKSGSRAVLAVPLLRENLLLGALVVSRNSPGPFAPEVIDLLKTFATQSAVAIQNARLFNETKEALDQQKASAEVLGAISASIADTKPVFDKILTSCARLFAGKLVGITLVGEDGKIYLGAYEGPGRERFEKGFPLPMDRNSGSGLAILEKQVLHFPDLEAPGVPEAARAASLALGTRAALFAPMLWEERGVGVIFVCREHGGEFTEKEIALLKTFADQAVIAIQNARLFREIQEKSAQLEVANKHKSDFLANMSHELRTPLNAIIGFSEAMMDRLFGDLNEKQADYLKDIHESGKHLLSLINDILDLSKIEAGRMELELSSFHLPSAISNAITLIRERAMRHGIALGVHIDERLGEFQADERKLKQVLLNLLSNAVKFTPDGGRVDVSAKLDTDKVEISVKDTGVGISPEDQASLFEEFKQFGKDRSRKAEGTGLGLSLTKRLVELHGGQILVDSAVGHGSTFRVMLPLPQHGASQ
jgi:GAF domain-containing protein